MTATTTYTIRIHDGHLTFVYDDALTDLLTAGEATVRRVSHVEPTPGGGWLADMGPVGGPVLGDGGEASRLHKDCDCDGCEQAVAGLTPFATRAAALQAERDWLTREKGL